MECPENPEEAQGTSLKTKGITELLSEEFYTVVFIGVLICKLSGKGFGGKGEKQEEQGLILVKIQSLVPASEAMGQIWGTMRTQTAARRHLLTTVCQEGFCFLG